MKTEEEITELVGRNFHCFGGGHGSSWNPITEAMKNEPLAFAAGVPVLKVVKFVLEHQKSD